MTLQRAEPFLGLPASSTDEAVVRWDGTTGNRLQNSGVLIDDSDNVSGVADLTMTGALATPTSITMAEDGWVGIGATLERVVFDGSGGVVNVSAADLHVTSAAPTLKFVDTDGNDFSVVVDGGLMTLGNLDASPSRFQFTSGHLGIGNSAPTAGHILIGSESYATTGTVIGYGCFPEYAPTSAATANTITSIQGNTWFSTANWGPGSRVQCLDFYPAPLLAGTAFGSADLDISAINTAGILNILGRTITADTVTAIALTPITNIFGGTDGTTANVVRGIYVYSAAATTGTWGRLCGLEIEPQTSGTINQGLWMAGDNVGCDIVFGAGQDANIYYNGTNLIIDPDLVGTGWVHIGAAADNSLACGKLGVGTATVPHGGIGAAKIAIEGTDSNTAGPHVQWTTSSDDYPTLQILSWSHNNIRLGFDAYYDGSEKSSSSDSNFQISKLTTVLAFSADKNIAQGGAITWVTAFQVTDDAEVTFSPGSSRKTYWRDSAIYIASLADGYLDVAADTQIRINQNTQVTGSLVVTSNIQGNRNLILANVADDNHSLSWGSSDVVISPSYITDQFVLYVGANAGRQLVFGGVTFTTDYGHATPTNPTFFIHSVNSPATNPNEWIGIYHDQTNGRIDLGTGTLIIDSEVEIGEWPASAGYALFGNADLDHSQAGNYALMQAAAGQTFINCVLGTNITWRINNQVIETLDSTGFLVQGATKKMFRDSAIYIASLNDGYLDLVADTQIRLNASVYTQSIIDAGTADTQYGHLRLHGHATGSLQGGVVYFYTAADHDASINYFGIRAYSDDFEFTSVTTPKLTYKGGEGYWQFDASLLFNGDAAGLCYGEIYVRANAVATNVTVAGTYVQFLGFANDGESNNATPDHTNDHITITKAGRYLVTVSIHVESTGAGGADEFGFEVRKNNGAVIFDNMHAHRQMAGGGTDVGSVGMNGIVDLAVNDTIELWVTNEDSTDDVLIEDCTLSIVQVGGT